MTRCELSNVDTVHLMRAGIIGDLHIVDIESADPDDLRFELTGYHVPLNSDKKPPHFHLAICADSVLRLQYGASYCGAESPAHPHASRR
jgi:hypothetical protein